MPGEKRIPLGEYEHYREIGVACEGVVVEGDVELFRVYCETIVVGYYENKWHMSYGTATRSYEVLIHPKDNTKVANQYDRLSYEPESIKHSAVQDQVRKKLLDSLLTYYREYYGKTGKDSPFGPVEIKIDVPADRRRAAFQDDFAQLKSKIENGTIRRSDFKDNVQRALKREIDTYFACFDPNDSNYKSFWAIEDKFDWESLIPVWGSLKMSTESLNRGLVGEGAGHYFHSAGHFLMAFADAICLGIGTSATQGIKLTGIIEKAPTSISNKVVKIRTETFEIGEGVRRSKASQLLGHQTVTAMDYTGAIFEVRVKNLRSPMKNAIDIRTPFEQNKYERIYKGLKEGDKLPPIYVHQGNRGIHIFDVIFIR